jgi:hypothetical protein
VSISLEAPGLSFRSVNVDTCTEGGICSNQAL